MCNNEWRKKDLSNVYSKYNVFKEAGEKLNKREKRLLLDWINEEHLFLDELIYRAKQHKLHLIEKNKDSFTGRR